MQVQWHRLWRSPTLIYRTPVQNLQSIALRSRPWTSITWTWREWQNLRRKTLRQRSQSFVTSRNSSSEVSSLNLWRELLDRKFTTARENQFHKLRSLLGLSSRRWSQVRNRSIRPMLMTSTSRQTLDIHLDFQADNLRTTTTMMTSMTRGVTRTRRTRGKVERPAEDDPGEDAARILLRHLHPLHRRPRQVRVLRVLLHERSKGPWSVLGLVTIRPKSLIEF